MASLQFERERQPTMQLVLPDGTVRSIGHVANLTVHSDAIEESRSVLDAYRRFIVTGRSIEAELRVRLFADCVNVQPKPKKRTRRRKR